MRGKRSKQYRKLMEQFSMSFGFREPYQVLGMSSSELEALLGLLTALQSTQKWSRTRVDSRWSLSLRCRGQSTERSSQVCL